MIRFLTAVTAGAMLGWLAAAHAADPVNDSFTIEQVMSAPFASGMTAASGAARVAWLVNDRGRRNVWVAGAPDWQGRSLTNFSEDDGQELSEIAWAPDGSYLLFTRGGDSENGGENPNPGLNPKKPEQAIWRADWTGSGARQLTIGHAAQISSKGDAVAFLKQQQIYLMKPTGEPAELAVEQKGSPSQLRWSPDGSQLAFTSDRGEHSFIGVYSRGEKKLHYVDASVDSDGEAVWSPDGLRIAHLRIPAEGGAHFFSEHRSGEPWSIRVVDVKSGAGREIFRASDGAGSVYRELDGPRQLFWGSGDLLVFAWERTGWLHLYSVEAAGGKPRELTPGEGEVENAALSADGNAVYFSANFGDIDRRHLWSAALAGDSATKPVTSGAGIEWTPSPMAGGAVAFLESTYNQRAHAAVHAGAAEAKTLGAEAGAEFPAKLLERPQPVMITAADGIELHGQLFLPPDDGRGRRHPALIFFHGGSRRQMLLGFHYMYYYSNAYSMNQYLASKGYVVLSVNYRSGIGYGLNFREALHYGAHGASEFEDVLGAGLYLKGRSDVDPKRIGLWGGSYGGYLTALGLARASDLFAAGVDFHGVHDWSSLRDYFGSRAQSGDPEQTRAWAEAARLAFESSPMASVDTWRSPVLLIHGDDDRNVDFAQTVMLVEALRKRRVEFEELILPNEIHDFLLHRSWLEGYHAAAEFFGRRLGSDAAGMPAAKSR